MLQTLSAANQDLRLLPVLIQECQLPIRIRYMNYLNLASTTDEELEWLRLIKAITTSEKYTKAIIETEIESKKDIGWDVVQDTVQNEAKVLVVGEGSVGKTSLVQRLIWNKFNTSESATEGIAVNKWNIDGKWVIENSRLTANNQQLKIQLNIWDFGGQEIMHATHQFFLTKRSLYLLVLDARLTQEENRVEYWLKIIQSFGGDSPVLSSLATKSTSIHLILIKRACRINIRTLQGL